jgi:WD40 repeat protein
VRLVAFSPDGERVHSLDTEGRLLHWDAATGKKLGEAWIPSAERLRRDSNDEIGNEFTRVNRETVYGRSLLEFRNLESGKVEYVIPNTPNLPFAFSPDGTAFATRGYGDTEKIKVHDAATGDLLWKCPLSEGSWGLALAPDRRTIATTTIRAMPRPFSPKILPALAGPDFGPVEIVVTLWDAITGRSLFCIGSENETRGKRSLDHGDSPNLAFSPDGKSLVVAYDEAVTVFDVVSGTKLCAVKFTDIDRRKYSLCYSPDSKTLAIGSLDGIRLLTIPDRQIRTITGGHNDLITAMDFSPDGKKLATGSRDTTVMIWDLATVPQAPTTLPALK